MLCLLKYLRKQNPFENQASIKNDDKKQKEMERNKNIRDGLALHNIKLATIPAETTFGVI